MLEEHDFNLTLQEWKQRAQLWNRRSKVRNSTVVLQYLTTLQHVEFGSRCILTWKYCPGTRLFGIWHIAKGGRLQRTDRKLPMLGRSLQKKVGSRCRARTGNWPCWEGCWHRKGTDRKSFLAERKGHVVSHMICLAIVVFSIRCSSQNQLMMCTEVPLYNIVPLRKRAQSTSIVPLPSKSNS